MGYAFENTPAHEMPEGELLAIWRMNATIRDSALTDQEYYAKCAAIRECEATAAMQFIALFGVGRTPSN